MQKSAVFLFTVFFKSIPFGLADFLEIDNLLDSVDKRVA